MNMCYQLVTHFYDHQAQDKAQASPPLSTSFQPMQICDPGQKKATVGAHSPKKSKVAYKGTWPREIVARPIHMVHRYPRVVHTCGAQA